jgi:hypothetical protein
MSADNTDSEDCDTEDCEGPGSSSSDELRYLEADEAWDNYAQTIDLTTSPRDYTPRVFHNRKRKLTLPSSLPTTTNFPLPSTLPTATNVAKTDNVITINIIAIVSLLALAFLLLPHFTCTCTLSI